MQLNITTTNIRKLVEIEMEKCKRDGIINEQEREAVKNINGHSSPTVADFYLKLDRDADAHNGRMAFAKLLHEDGLEFQIKGGQTEDWNFKDDLVHAPWGTKHPSYNKTTPKNMRVHWSKDEIDYICQWIITNKDTLAVNRVAKCLHHIEQDDQAYPIFHVNHVLTSARLRTGYDKAIKMLNVQHI